MNITIQSEELTIELLNEIRKFDLDSLKYTKGYDIEWYKDRYRF